jgi:hypothetical protein
VIEPAALRFFLLLAGCGLAAFPAVVYAQVAAVRVQVRASAQPVADAEVTAGNQRARTGADGVAVLSLPLGQATVTVEKSGFLSASAEVTVLLDSEPVVEIELAEQPAIE